MKRLAAVVAVVSALVPGCVFHSRTVPELTWQPSPPASIELESILTPVSDAREHGDRFGRYGGGAVRVDYVLPREKLLPWLNEALAVELAAHGVGVTSSDTRPDRGTWVEGTVTRAAYLHTPLKRIAGLTLELSAWRDGACIYRESFTRMGEASWGTGATAKASGEALAAALRILLDHAIPVLVAALKAPPR